MTGKSNNKNDDSTVKNKPAKFVLIKQYICKNIESGKWAQHAKVPSENELTVQFNVSRMTARRALQELTEQGLLVRSQGTGTFVAAYKSQPSLLEIRNIHDEIIDRGNRHKTKQFMLRSIAVTEEISTALKLNKNDHAFYSEVLHYENDKPVQLEKRLVNARLVPDYLLQSFNEITPQEYLSIEAPLTQVSHTIEATLANEDVCRYFDIQASSPCLNIKRQVTSTKGVVSVVTYISPADRYYLKG